MTDSLPVLGAAMGIQHLETYADWLIADQRDLEIQDPISHQFLDGDWASRVKAAKSMLDGYSGRLGIHGPFWNMSMIAFDPKFKPLFVERYKQALEVAAELGATHMVVHSPYAFLGMPIVRDTPNMGYTELMNLAHDTMADVVAFAEAIGCTLVIENIYDRNPRLLIGLVDSFDSDHVRMSLDTGHAHIAHTDGAPPVDYWVNEAGYLLRHVHLQDVDGHNDRHWSPGKGSINWFAFFNALAELEHHPRLLLELHNYDEIRSAAAWLAEQGFVR